MGNKPNLTIEERILLILLDSLAFRDDFEVPASMTQEGLSRLSGAARPNVARSLKRLKGKMKIDERTAHVKGQRRRKKVYLLKAGAVEEARRLRDQLSGILVTFNGERTELGKAARACEMSMLEAFSHLDDGSVLVVDHNGVDDGGNVRGGDGKETRPASSPGRERPFYGRKRELQRMRDWMGDTNSRIFLVHGLPGIGKTTLVERFCGELARPQVVWYRIPPLNSLFGILHGLELALGVDGLMEMSRTSAPADMAVSIGSQLVDGGKPRVLLVLDDLHLACDEFIDVLAALLTMPSAFKICITSRTKGGFYNRRDVRVTGTVGELALQGMKGRGAMSLLKARGFDREAALTVISRTGGHPLALELVEPGTVPVEDGGGDAIEPPPGPGFGEVQAFIREEIWRKLDPGGAEALQFISIFRRPVPRDAAVLRSAGLEPKAVDTLIDRSLLESTPGGLEVHTLIGSVISDRIPPARWLELHSLAARHYLKDTRDLDSFMEALYHLSTARECTRVIDLLRTQGMIALREGFVELMMILSELDPGELGPERNGWFHYMWGYGELMVGHTEGASKHLGIAEALLGEVGDDTLILGVKEALGRLNRDEPSTALELFGEAIEAFEGMNGPDDDNVIRAISAYNGSGLALKELGRMEDACKRYRRAMELADEYDILTQRASAVFNLATLHIARGADEKAWPLLREGLELASEVADEHLTMEFLATMGMLHTREGKVDDAIREYTEALDHAIGSADMWKTAEGSLDIGYRYRRNMMDRSLSMKLVSYLNGRRAEELQSISNLYEHICSLQHGRTSSGAAAFHRKAIMLFDELGSKREAAKARNNLGIVLKADGDLDGARHHYNEALKIDSEIGDVGAEAITHFNLAMLLHRMDNGQEALRHFETAAELFSRMGRKREANRARQMASCVHE